MYYQELYRNRDLEKLYQSLVYKCVREGHEEAIKFLYSSVYEKDIASMNCIKTIAWDTALNLESLNDFDAEYIYYLGMAVISPININSEVRSKVAKRCFEMAKAYIPKSEARTAYIDLIETLEWNVEELLKEESTEEQEAILCKVNVLRDWAYKEDLFSMTMLAKILNSKFSEEANELIISTDALELLGCPLNHGYPPAVIYYNDLMAEFKSKHYYNACRFVSSSYRLLDIDYNT